MKKILIVTGTVRKNNLGDKIADFIKPKFENAEVKTFKLSENNIPLFESEFIPKSEEYSVEDAEVKKWQESVKWADEVLFLVPEYNGYMSAAQKNAIDHLYAEWNDKKVSAIFYNFGGSYVFDMFWTVITERVGGVKNQELRLVIGDGVGFDGIISKEDDLEKFIQAVSE